MLEILFWGSSVLAGFSYLVYPLLLKVFSTSNAVNAEAPQKWPKLSVIIAAYNEEQRIGGKLNDTLERCNEYPGETEILVVSDASTDTTEEIIRSYPPEKLLCFRQEPRAGKEAAQKIAIANANGGILVFTDASTRIGSGGLVAIATLLCSDGVGAVSSEDRFESDGKVVGEGLYVRYEMALRRLESRCAGLVGVSGSLFAARRSVCEEWLVNVPSDLMIATLCAQSGLRAVSSSDVVGVYSDIKDPDRELSRKRRTIVRGMAGLAEAFRMLNFRNHGDFILQLIGHKVLRWATPWMLATALTTSAVLAVDSGFFLVLLMIQVTIYLLMIVAVLVPGLKKIGFVRLCFYFGQVNLAAAMAFVSFIRGERFVTWEPSKR